MPVDHSAEWQGRISASCSPRFYQSTPPPASLEDARRLDTDHSAVLAQICRQVEQRTAQLVAEGRDPASDPGHCQWLARIAGARRYHLGARAAYQAWMAAERANRPKPQRGTLDQRLNQIEARLEALEKQAAPDAEPNPALPP